MPANDCMDAGGTTNRTFGESAASETSDCRATQERLPRRESMGPVNIRGFWMPAFAGMTRRRGIGVAMNAVSTGAAMNAVTWSREGRGGRGPAYEAAG